MLFQVFLPQAKKKQKNTCSDEDCFSNWRILGSTELNENGTHERGFPRGFGPIPPNEILKKLPLMTKINLSIEMY